MIFEIGVSRVEKSGPLMSRELDRKTMILINWDFARDRKRLWPEVSRETEIEEIGANRKRSFRLLILKGEPE